jgi:hypothetical protein
MKKKKEIPSKDPRAVKDQNIGEGQRPATHTREDIKSQDTESYNTNNGPEHRSRKKS